MGYKLFEKVKLKDGRFGFIVEILSSGNAYMVETDGDDFSERLVTVKEEDIETKIA